MKSKRIKFAKEYCFTAFLDNAESVLDLGVTDYQLLQEDLLVKTKNDDYVSAEIRSSKNETIDEVRKAYNRSLLRTDVIKGNAVTFTLLGFSDSVEYDNENPLRIVVDQAISADLKTNNIEFDDAVKKIKEQLIVNEQGDFCFAYSYDEATENIELIGDRYSFTVARTSQDYLHFIRIRRRYNQDRIDSPITLMKGRIEIVNELTDRAILTARANEQYSKLLGSDAEFIQLWNIYSELEMESIRQQASEMGYLKYKNVRSGNGGMLIFDLAEGYTTREFCKDNMYYVAISTIDIANPIEYNPRAATIIGTEIDTSCIGTREFKIKEEMDMTRAIPQTGYLLPSISGSEIQKKRRSIAYRNIVSNKCAMPGLKNIIQGGKLVGASGRHFDPISVKIETELFGKGGNHFTDKQKEAIDAAINTPDIALIQGPPGTGKTTVIRAIVKRIDELWDSKAKILISSTQHDAVDNAVEKINYGGVPVNRISVRRGKEEENVSIYGWIDSMIESCETWLEQNDGTERGTVRAIFEKLLFIEEANSLEEKYKLLSELGVELEKLGLDVEINKAYTSLMVKLGGLVLNNGKSSGNESNELKMLIDSQRLSKEAFLDDGIIQLKQLERYLKFDSDLEFEIPDYWRKLKRITEDCVELEEYLHNLQEDCNRIEELSPAISYQNEELIYEDIKRFVRMTRLGIISKGNNKASILNSLIWEFKQELTNIANVDDLIKAYSKINAATCQQAANANLSTSMKGFDDEYDFVIIDEAARSNPLDLLIPMSMGKKIILVGDHKQLPHMVEKDVVKKVAEKTDKRDIEEVLEESLFMRLFSAVSAEDKAAGIHRTAMLSEQYRMHPDICDLVNQFYDGKLESLCKPSDREHNLNLYENKAVAWLDVSITEKYPMEYKRASVSRQGEVEVIKQQLNKVLQKENDFKIGIITFYSAQAKLLNQMVQDEFPSDSYRIFVGTVDAFQGKEFDVVFLSVVRANDEEDMKKRVGFLASENRLNVAFSRAKRLLIAVGDSKTVASNDGIEYIKALNEMYKKCQTSGGYYEQII